MKFQSLFSENMKNINLSSLESAQRVVIKGIHSFCSFFYVLHSLPNPSPAEPGYALPFQTV